MLRSERLRALRNTWAGKARAAQHFPLNMPPIR